MGRKRKDEMGGEGREYVRGEGNVKELKWINEKKSIFFSCSGETEEIKKTRNFKGTKTSFLFERKIYLEDGSSK